MRTAMDVDRHPLIVLMQRRRWTREVLARRVAAQHKLQGDGAIAARGEKVSRWVAGSAVPLLTVQVAMATVLDVDPEEVHRRGWPDWLLLALRDDHTVVESPWTPAGTLAALDDVGGPVDRRGFLITSTGALPALIAQWATAPPAAGAAGGRRVDHQVPDLFDARLDALRHLDDQVGSGQTYDAAAAELRLITRVLKEASYDERVARRLYGCAAEASRLAGWCAYDDGHHAAAERHFTVALRSSASAGDDTTGATVLAFWCNLRYANGDPQGALDLVHGALASSGSIASPRVLAMLHARRARAHSRAGEATAAYRAVDAAFSAYGRAGPAGEDLPGMYWVTAGELHQVAASSALTLGDPKRALDHFQAAITHPDSYDAERESRGTAIYLARRAEAHLALGDIDAAVETACDALEHLGGVDSARGTAALDDLRSHFAAFQRVPAVRSFLEMTV